MMDRGEATTSTYSLVRKPWDGLFDYSRYGLSSVRRKRYRVMICDEEDGFTMSRMIELATEWIEEHFDWDGDRSVCGGDGQFSKSLTVEGLADLLERVYEDGAASAADRAEDM